MNRKITMLFSSLEALLVVAIGVAIPLVPLTLLWAVQFGFGPDWLLFWRAAVDIWLLGFGVDLSLALDPALAAGLGVARAEQPFVVSIAVLGFALLTVLLAVRTGLRIAETPHRTAGTLVALGMFALMSAALTLTALHPVVSPSLWQGILLPTLFFAVGLGIGAETGRMRRSRSAEQAVPENALERRVHEFVLSWPREVRAVLAVALRGGAAASAAVLGVAAIAVAVLIVLGYASIIALYEAVYAGALGGAALTLAQLALLPDLVVWAASWFVGPGFAIGTGSSVSPLGTELGPIPAVPLFGALPTGDLAWGFLGLLVPVVAGFLLGAVLRPALTRALGEEVGVPLRVAAGVGIGVVAGLVLGLLAAASAGSAGPGRLVDVGPNALLVGLLATVEIGLPAALGMLAGAKVRERV
ncbi:cell division protein PerM [Herbiconiux sp. SYSU D00978]|uniref:cell division protein PerM n=1 Tax=Herbiconiux sp. SYSU D00978 TaxID=2812562 RepID=UPI001A95E19D|nr:DUF6350 family protein [Herbiconiux sp. SYSU D00978]